MMRPEVCVIDLPVPRLDFRRYPVHCLLCPRLGLNPYEQSWKSASNIGSTMRKDSSCLKAIWEAGKNFFWPASNRVI